MKRSRKYILLFLSIVGLTLLVQTANSLLQTRENIIYESKMWGAFKAVSFAINEYYGKNGIYPLDLQSLSVDFIKQSEGLPKGISNDEMLKQFSYKTDGISCEISLEIKKEYGGVLFKRRTTIEKQVQFAREGKNIKLTKYLNGKLIGETIYNAQTK